MPLPSRLPLVALACTVLLAGLIATDVARSASPGGVPLARAGQTATASSHYPSYEPEKAIDGVSAENNLWQSVAGEPAPWWQVQLAEPTEVTGLGISFAGYQGQQYSVPREIRVSVSAGTGDPVEALTITADEMPATGDPYSAKMRYYTLPEPVEGDVVRLAFPEDGATSTAHVALGEVDVLTPANEPNLALGRPASASSAQVNSDPAQATNGSAGQYPDMWQTQVTPTPQPDTVPTWWQVDLGAVGSISAVGIAYAGYQNVFYGVPETTVVQVKDALCDDFVSVARITSDDSPGHDDPFEPRTVRYALPAGTSGRYVRLLFPDGNKQPHPAGLPANGAALSEVAVYGTPGDPVEAPTETATLRSGFGEVVVDLTHPMLTSLKLHDFDGKPSGRSLLSDLAEPRRGGRSYLTTADGRTFDSTASCGHQAQASDDAVIIRDIVPGDASGAAGPVVEDWELRTSSDRSLKWTITQRWQEDTVVNLSGTPALFTGPFGYFGSQPAATNTSRVTSTFWYDPAFVQPDGPEACPGYYAPWFGEETSTRNVCQIITKPSTWAIYKLWTNTHEGSDLRLQVEGSGHLYRRGHSIAAFGELGSVASPTLRFERQAGDVDVTTLTLTPTDQRDSGYQLDVSIPDKEMEASLKEQYGAAFNGGTVTDQKRFNFGNNSEGVNYTGSAWMQGHALAAGVAAAAPLSERPYPLDRAFRGHLEQILATVDEDGLSHFGFYAAGNRAAATDQNLQVVLGVRDYVVHAGDVEFARESLPALRRILRFHLDRIQPNGLYRAPVAAPAWYYDAVKFSGYNTYYQAFLYEALRDVAEMETAVGEPGNAATYRSAAEQLAQAINDVLWMPDAPGGPRYMDWLDDEGNAATYFIDIVQYPLIAFGIAPPERARDILATADARMAELTDTHGYTRQASLASLWPQPPSVNVFGFPFGTYMNGGSLMAQTYWEVVARAKMGDVDGTWGAARLLKRHAERFGDHSWVGDNAADIQGRMRNGDLEPYLADMMVAPASLVNGLLGIRLTWDGLTVEPHLPAGWDEASARIRYKGRVHDVAIRGGVATVSPDASFDLSPAVSRSGRVVTFTSTSVDPDGNIARFAWDLDGDGAFDDAEGATVKRRYGRPGVYAIGLQVTDDQGVVDTVTKELRVDAGTSGTVPCRDAEPCGGPGAAG
jgi:hypothetical protein